MKNRIVTLATIASLLVGANLAVLSMARNPEPVIPVKSTVTTAPVEQAEPVKTTEPTPAPAPVEQTTTPIAAQPAPAPAPVYRSFDEIIMDYPNMSQGYNAIECSHVIEAAFPNRFTDEKREANIKLIAQRFASSCSAAFRGTDTSTDNYAARQPIYLRDIDGTGDFWQKNGGL